MNILEIEGLTKTYGTTKALDDVSFNVAQGEICGVVGPNGAGKTTLLRLINALLVSDSGKINVNGMPASLEAGRHIGYMPEERGLYEKMTVEDQIMFFGQLKGGDKARLRVVMGEYMDIFNLHGQGKRKVKELSKGNQQKVQIISTLVHEPELVILDEPFSGFDPINGALLQSLIARLREKGSTIMLSSHNMPALEEMCTSIALINHGRLLVKGEIGDVKEQHRTGELLLTTRQPLELGKIEETGLIEKIVETEPSQWRRGYAYCVRKKEGVANNHFLAHAAKQADILHFEEKLPSLKDIFLEYTAEAVEN